MPCIAITMKTSKAVACVARKPLQTKFPSRWKVRWCQPVTASALLLRTAPLQGGVIRLWSIRLCASMDIIGRHFFGPQKWLCNSSWSTARCPIKDDGALVAESQIQHLWWEAKVHAENPQPCLTAFSLAMGPFLGRNP